MAKKNKNRSYQPAQSPKPPVQTPQKEEPQNEKTSEALILSFWNESELKFDIDALRESIRKESEEYGLALAKETFESENAEAIKSHEAVKIDISLKQAVCAELDKKIIQLENDISLIEKQAETLEGEMLKEAQHKAEDIILKAEKDAETANNKDLARIDKQKNEIQDKQIKLDIELESLNADKAEVERQKKSNERIREILKQKADIYSDASPEKVAELNLVNSKNEEFIKSLTEKYVELDTKLKQSRLTEMRLNERTVDELLQENDELHELIDELRDRNNAYSEEHIRKMEAALDEHPKLLNERDILFREITHYRNELVRTENVTLELETAKAQIELVKKLRDQLADELQKTKKTLEAQTGEVCPNLSRIDNEEFNREASELKELKEKQKTSIQWNLNKIVDHVRSFAAAQAVPLYYSAEDISGFIAGLASSKISILQGLSGTGKTSLPRVFAKAISGESKIVSVESSWRDRSELLGYYNDFNKKFTAKDFTCHLYRAGYDYYKDTPYFIVLDEINLSRVEYYFADFLSVLEQPDKNDWRIPLVDVNLSELTEGPKKLFNGNTLIIPENVWFVGTANRDESTFEITNKVYDRAQVLNFSKKASAFQANSKIQPVAVSYDKLKTLFEAAQDDFAFDYENNEIVESIDSFLTGAFKISFGNRIGNQLNQFVNVYIACGQNTEKKDDVLEAEAIDYQIANKVLRKLEHVDITKEDEFKKLLQLCNNYKLTRCAEIVSEHIG